VKKHIGARAGLRLALVAACALATGTAYAAETGGALGQGQEAGAAAPSPASAATVAAVKVDRHVRLGKRLVVRGRITPAAGGRKVRLRARIARRWRTVDRTLSGRGGRFRTVWRPGRAGVFRVRVVAPNSGVPNARASRSRGRRAFVYRPAPASWYGPGFYGNRTGCGGTLGYGTLGVAHKWLPCGTRVRFRYRGRSVAVRVIDRGPYAGNREWDLTAATKRRLGFPSTGIVWSTR
jgi:peptidoglycan lytic transglycosylase